MDRIPRRSALALLLLAACHEPQVPPLVTNGWHRCPGTELGCREWENCRPNGCAWWGDPNGPGPADTDHSGSDPSQTPDR